MKILSVRIMQIVHKTKVLKNNDSLNSNVNETIQIPAEISVLDESSHDKVYQQMILS